MESASGPVMVSPSSDERLWSKLRDRVDSILEQRSTPKRSSPSTSSYSLIGVESETGKRFREDSSLLIRGLDSAAASLAHLTSSLNSAQQNLKDLGKPSLTNLQQRESHGTEEDEDDARQDVKRHCGPMKLQTNKDEAGRDECSAAVAKSGNLKKAKNLAILMASKAASLARELKGIKSELCFVQERCALLEEENRRLRDGAEKGVRPEEDDLVRLQLEVLLAEKSRLANENANLTRENQCLHQLVEYHQLVIQDPLSPLYEQDITGICLDFSSPVGKEDANSEDENGCEESKSASPTASNDKHCKELFS